MKSISEATGVSTDQIKAELKGHGDLGLVAEQHRAKQSTLGFNKSNKALTIPALFRKLHEMASMSGAKSAEKKRAAVKELLAACASGSEG